MTFRITHMNVRHSHVQWHSPFLLSKMLLVPASDSLSDFQLEEMDFVCSVFSDGHRYLNRYLPSPKTSFRIKTTHTFIWNQKEAITSHNYHFLKNTGLTLTRESTKFNLGYGKI